MELPGAVAALAQNAAANGGTAYVHCTGGSGSCRLPAEPCVALGCLGPRVARSSHASAVLCTCRAGTIATLPCPRPRFRRLLPSPSAAAAAGLGRAPATALAYMWWFKGWHLEDAYQHLTGAAVGLAVRLLRGRQQGTARRAGGSPSQLPSPPHC